ncbi:adaptor protein NBP2 NDAI_0J00850 [Naumovozyma dairenensis CBS 421]|uniref:SH3 domain-containing protein n=1 Tax=Naumovozyma dairenensis (strain ATCC 10597 / BCRC 20456 / CBS 421 / NBRC 0211 / NRRL Y-12639) TaxID=1071378 RepID=G0WGP9_NAUDC|nr:hypothetical protein NDAI_0J00850 [Naumovozyma dairenensis CBS 421]CCD26977.1 hypothetical protein NDAI_0J00850 [Naumovozyma dairenensis CBS 421]
MSHSKNESLTTIVPDHPTENQWKPQQQPSRQSLNASIHEEDETSTIGYISIKDYAYPEDNSLHYGYFEEEEDDNESEEDASRIYSDDDDTANHRQSIVLPKDYVVNQWAVALYDFEPENDNELGLKENDIVFISYKHGQGWLVAENEKRTQTGLVPEEYVSYLESGEEDVAATNGRTEEQDDDPARPFYLTHMITQGVQLPPADAEQEQIDDIKYDNNVNEDDDEWEDVDQLENNINEKLNISTE